MLVDGAIGVSGIFYILEKIGVKLKSYLQLAMAFLAIYHSR